MKLLLLCIFVILHVPMSANATVIEFNGDGSVTTFAARDYLAETRHQRKKPKVSTFSGVWKPQDNFGQFVTAAARQYGVDQKVIHGQPPI